MSPTTRRRDLVSKREYYLAAGAAEYWVIDLARGTVEVFAEPSPAGYRRSFVAGERIRLVAFPDVEMVVADFLES